MTPRPKRRANDGGRGPVGRAGHRDGARLVAEVEVLFRLGFHGTSEDATSTLPTEAEARALWFKFGPTMLAEYTANSCRSLAAAAAIALFHEDAAVRRGAARWLAWERARYRIDPRPLGEAEHVAALAAHDAIEPPRPSSLPPFDVGTPDPNLSAWDAMTPAEKFRFNNRGGSRKDKEPTT